MAEEQEPSGPSLEPPALFRRRKRPQQKDQPAPPPPPVVLSVDDSPTTILDDLADAEATQPPAPLVPPPPAPVRPERTGPVVPGRVAAGASGLLVGAVIVGLTTASFELCSRIQGTNSCGGRGLLLLVAILVAAVVLGAVVLRLCEVPEPGSTSFLAVGLTSVIALLFLVDSIFEWWMIIVIPLVSIATFLLSHWVTTTFVEPARTETSPVDDDWFHHIR